jgi:hypothetical protein
MLAAIALTTAVWPWAADSAQADTNNGIGVPDVVFAQGTGDHTVDITIASSSPAVGSGATIEVYASSPYVVGVSGSSVGANCSASSGTWTCNANNDLRAGVIQVTISTATADCNSSLVCQSPLMAKVEGPGGWLAQGSVEIKTTQPPVAPPTSKAPTTSSAPTTVAPVQTSVAPVASPHVSAPAGAVSKPASPTASTVESSASVASAPLVSVVAATPSALALTPVADAHTTSSTKRVAEVVIPFVVLLLAAGFLVRRIAASRRRHAGLVSEATSQSDSEPTSDGGIADE